MTFKFPVPLTVTFNLLVNDYRHLFTSLVPNSRLLLALTPRNHYWEFKVRIGLVDNESILFHLNWTEGLLRSMIIPSKGFMLDIDFNH